jgi:hypothetical protein
MGWSMALLECMQRGSSPPHNLPYHAALQILLF